MRNFSKMVNSPWTKQKSLFVIVTIMLVQLTTSANEDDDQSWTITPGMFTPKFTEAENKFFENLKTHPNMASSRAAGNPRIRRELRCLSTDERFNFFLALKQMKKNMVGQYSEYDQLQVRHTPILAPAAHNTPSFYGWHREFVVEAERAIQKYCPYCMMPYWDNRLDARLGLDPANSVFFHEKLMGNARGGAVTTGVAANWKSVGDSRCNKERGVLNRDHVKNVNYFMNDAHIQQYKNAKMFKDFLTPWNRTPEIRHGYIHLNFGPGSHMFDFICSPQDPIFFLHHSFVDYLFELARLSLKKINMLVYPEIPSKYTNSAGSTILKPFAVTNEFASLNDFYTRDIYKYETTPGDVRCRKDEDCCESGIYEFLWCNKGQCVSRAVEGSRLTEGFPANACYCPRTRPAIVSNICKC